MPIVLGLLCNVSEGRLPKKAFKAGLIYQGEVDGWQNDCHWLHVAEEQAQRSVAFWRRHTSLVVALCTALVEPEPACCACPIRTRAHIMQSNVHCSFAKY